MSPRSPQGPQQRAISPSRSWIYDQSGGASGGGGARGHAGANAPAVTDFVIQKGVNIGDGTDHLLSDFYATLADAQKDYPFAQALTDTLAWCAIQSAIYRSPYVYLPPGSYVVNRTIDCTNKEFGGVHFYGAGGQSQSAVTYTDLAIDAADGTKITSAAQPFGARHRWMVLQITGGTGFTPKQVMISAVSSAGVATCTVPVGFPGSTGGQGKSITGCGSRIIAHTNDVVFDCAGSGFLTFEDFYIDGATGTNNATIGFLFARTYEQPAPESSLVYMARVAVVLRNFAHDGLGVNVNQCLNAGQYLGSIGVVNWCSENLTFQHCYFQADRSYIGQNQLPMNIVDDYPVTVDADGLSHGQPLRFFLPKSVYATLYGSDVATPIHITAVSVAGQTITYTTLEDLHDPALFRDLGGGSIGWYNNGGVTVRGVTGWASPYPVNVTYRQLTLLSAHSFSVTLFSYEHMPAGSYGGGGTAHLNTSFSEGMDTMVSSAFIAMGGPCITLGGVGMWEGVGIYCLSYHPSVNPNVQAAYQIAGQCGGVHITGSCELCSRIFYSRYVVYDLRLDLDVPQDPDAPAARMWLDGQLPDDEGGVLVPGIVAGHVRVNPLYGKPVHHLMQAGPITGTVACKVVLASNQDFGLEGGLGNIQIESSEVWNPRLPELGVWDFATHWGRREIGGPLTLVGPIYSKDTAFRVNGIVGADTDVQVSMMDATNPVVVHTFANHGLVEGQVVSVFGQIGLTLSEQITNLPCHVLSPNSFSIPGVSADPDSPYLGGGYVRANGKAAYFALYDAGTVTWFLMKGVDGSFVLLDERVNRSCILFARDFATIGGTGIAYTDLVIGADNTTCTSAAKPFWSPLNVGQTLHITGGAGWTVQTVTIVSVDASNVAKCSAALGTPGSTGGTALNAFALQLEGDFITLPQQAAPTGTLNYLAINDSGTVLPRTKAESQSDLGITGGGGGTDPTTTKGDLIVRSATAPDRLGVGADGQSPVADSTQALGVRWGNSQTPWAADVNGANHNLTGVNQLIASVFFALSATDIMAGQPASMTWYNGAFSPRWQITKANAEGGGNSGSDLRFLNYSDAGASLGIPITIMRATGNVGIGATAPVHQLELSTDSAAKPGTNTWLVYSDVRLKQNSRPYAHGLDILRRLNPMQAEYNGENGIPAGMPVIGFNAQDVEAVEPTWVTKSPGKIAGEATDVLSVNSGALVYVLLNAVRELDARVAALEAKLQALLDAASR